MIYFNEQSFKNMQNLYILNGVARDRCFELLEYIVNICMPTVKYWITHGSGRVAHNAVVFLKT